MARLSLHSVGWTLSAGGGSFRIPPKNRVGGLAMAAKPVDPGFNVEFLADLAYHAHKLINEFLALSANEGERATELIAEIQHIIAEFRRLRPPATFVKKARVRVLRAVEPCGVCGR